MIEDSDGPAVTALDNAPEHDEVVLALTEGENLRFCGSVHSIEVEAVEVGLHLFKVPGPVRDMAVAVMPVVDNPDVMVSRLVKCAADRNEVGRLSTPATVVVEPQLATKFRGPHSKGSHGGSSGSDIFGL